MKNDLYCAYGYKFCFDTQATLLGFNGEPLLRPLHGYLLGNGYRAYVPSLMRFMSPDSLSPFGVGGLNTYAYAEGDPINRTDPSGHRSIFSKVFRGIFGKYQRFSGKTQDVNGFNVFMSKHPENKKAQAITVLSHGDVGELSWGEKRMTGSVFVNAAEAASFETRKFDIHVIACCSADTNPNNGQSLIQRVANLTQRNAYGYAGEVFTVDSKAFDRPIINGTKVTTHVTKKDPFYWNNKQFNYNRAKATPEQVRGT